MVLMAVVTHDHMNSLSLGPGRISKSRLEQSKNLFYLLFSLIKRKALEKLHLCWGKIFLLLLLYRETLFIFGSLQSIALDLLEPHYFLLLSICKDHCSITFIFAVSVSWGVF